MTISLLILTHRINKQPGAPNMAEAAQAATLVIENDLTAENFSVADAVAQLREAAEQLERNDYDGCAEVTVGGVCLQIDIDPDRSTVTAARVPA